MVFGLARNTHAAIVEKCAAAAACGEEFIARGIVDDRVHHLAALAQRDRNRVGGQAVNVVRRAIQGIDHPFIGGEFALGGMAVLAGFFGKEEVIRVSSAQHVDNGLFRGPVDFRDIIVGTFSGHLKPLEINAGAVNDRTSAPGSLDGGIKHRVHDKSTFFLINKTF